MRLFHDFRAAAIKQVTVWGPRGLIDRGNGETGPFVETKKVPVTVGRVLEVILDRKLHYPAPKG